MGNNEKSAKNHLLRPHPGVSKFLLSTPARFYGEYENDKLLLTHAWPDFLAPNSSRRRLEPGPTYRAYFVAAFDHGEPALDEQESSRVLPSYHWVGDFLAVCLGVFFGKRFDHHGLLESNGLFSMPAHVVGELGLYSLPPFSSDVRADYGSDELNLVRLREIKSLLEFQGDSSSLRAFFTAGRFYLRALQVFEEQPEAAFLDLVTVGEILSNQYEYDDDVVLDERMRDLLAEVSRMLGASKAKEIRRRLLQVKRRYVLTLKKLVSDDFFETSESKVDWGRLNKEDFERNVAASYDLRSAYVHTGTSFGAGVTMLQGEFVEKMLGSLPLLDSKGNEKKLDDAPTLLGLERIVRRALLQFVSERICALNLRQPLRVRT